jgi:hypothetical protein
MFNPTYDQVKVGDRFGSDTQLTSGNGYFYYISTVLKVDPVSTRFGNPDRIVRVRIETNTGTVVDANKPMWVSQLLQGLV